VVLSLGDNVLDSLELEVVEGVRSVEDVVSADGEVGTNDDGTEDIALSDAEEGTVMEEYEE